MKRRHFLKSAGQMIGIPVMLNGIGVSALSKPAFFGPKGGETNRVLVLIQLNGGNDGLNTLIPLDQYSNLSKVRSNVLIPERKVLPLKGSLGLHPTMGGVKELFQQGKLGAIQSVGYPDQNRSHFRSMEIWSSASNTSFEPTGWMGRYLDSKYPGFPEDYPNADNPDPFGISMGSFASETCQGAIGNFSIALEDPFALRQVPESEDNGQYGPFYSDELAFIRSMINQTNKYGEKILGAAERGKNSSTYPNTRLGFHLKNVAKLISGGLQTKIYIVSLGGFDTHANQVTQGDPTKGEHTELLKTLSEAIKAFQDDLQAQNLEERVIAMTFSEFGRQIKSNGGFGTDHGTAAPLFLFGTCVNNQIMGDNPQIPDQLEPQEGVPMQYDFRDVYGSILMDWLGAEEEEVRELLFPDFRHLPLVTGCNDTTAAYDPLENSVEIFNFPNPFQDWTTIQFTSGREWVRLSVFDSVGREIKVLTNQRMPEGTHQVRFDAHGLPSGNYHYRILMEGRQKTKSMIKISN